MHYYDLFGCERKTTFLLIILKFALYNVHRLFRISCLYKINIEVTFECTKCFQSSRYCLIIIEIYVNDDSKDQDSLVNRLNPEVSIRNVIIFSDGKLYLESLYIFCIVWSSWRIIGTSNFAFRGGRENSQEKNADNFRKAPKERSGNNK